MQGLTRPDPSSIRSRRYTAADRARCLEVFDSNVPASFSEAERTEYLSYLDDLPGPYLLLESESDVLVACGGFAIDTEAGAADLCWGMVSRPLQGRGLGRLLALHRIEEIARISDVEVVNMNTTQHTQPFYERLGFTTIRVTRNGFGPGLHRCDLRLDLSTYRARPR